MAEDLCSCTVLTFGLPQDAMRSVTKQSIREARLKEIKEELLHSEKLKVRGVRGEEGRGRGVELLEIALGDWPSSEW